MKALRSSTGLRLLVTFVFGVAFSPSVAAERGLLEPDWNEPALAKARAAMVNAARVAAPRIEAREAETPLSLPRWGFGSNISRPTIEEQARARTALPTRAVSAWPVCAAQSAEPKEVRDKTGLWYSDHYDYGCLVISISGDRTFAQDLAFPTGVTASDDCADQSPIDTTDSDTRGRFELQLSLNHIPYTIVGRCSGDAETFCRNRVAQCALVGRLVLRGGQPQ
jgi:hypothetical protein